MIAIKGNWYCNKCKKDMKILYIDSSDIESIKRNSHRFCENCLDDNNFKKLKNVKIYNQNRELI